MTSQSSGSNDVIKAQINMNPKNYNKFLQQNRRHIYCEAVLSMTS